MRHLPPPDLPLTPTQFPTHPRSVPHSPNACSLSGVVPSGVGQVTAIPGVGTERASGSTAALIELKMAKSKDFQLNVYRFNSFIKIIY